MKGFWYITASFRLVKFRYIACINSDLVGLKKSFSLDLYSKYKEDLDIDGRLKWFWDYYLSNGYYGNYYSDYNKSVV